MLSQRNVVSTPLQPSSQSLPVSDGAVVVPQRNSGSRFTGPVLGGLCCLGLILFLIAATIILSLIPLYTPARTVDPLRREIKLIELANGSVLQVGQLNAAQRRTVENELQTILNNDPRTQGARVRVLDGVALANARRKRQTLIARFIQVTIIIIAPSPSIIAISNTILNRIVLSALATALLEQQGTTIATTTPIPTTTVITPDTTTNATRSLSRRSINEGGAPVGIVYIDTHRIAETKGLVNSISFYVDQTCALANIEIGAFNVISRNLQTNNAEFVLTQQSQTIKLDDVSELKPYMSLITIELCNENTAIAQSGNVCKGTKFEILPYQYIGIRSNTCRLGYATAPVDRVLATTLKSVETSDPFAKPYKNIQYAPSDFTVLQSITIEPMKSKNGEIKVNKAQKKAPRALFIGSYPPRRCGLAKFLDDLTNSYEGSYDVIAVDEDGVDPKSRVYSDKVIYRLPQADRHAYDNMAMLISSGPHDVINLQHEYGLFGGMMGEYIIGFMSSVKKPIITTMHTVIPEPNVYTKSITRAVCALSTRVIVMAELGRRILIDVYGIDKSKIVLLPHGVPDVPFDRSVPALKTKLGLDPNAPTMSTFGLIHRNKNIELALQAMKTVVKSVPNMMYLIVGQTHPAILKYEGESYRNELEKNIAASGLTNNVRFINKFVDNNELLDYLGASDIYLTPYAREDQYVSGTLSWAVGIGKAVISTPYLYAKELLSDGRGFLVPFNDEQSMGLKIVQVIQDSKMRDTARERAYKFGRHMTWPVVAHQIKNISKNIIVDA